MRHYLIIWILLVLNSSAKSQALENPDAPEVYEIQSLGDSIINLNSSSFWYADNSKSLNSIQDLSENKFKKLDVDSSDYYLSLNKASNFWIKIAVKSSIDLQDASILIAGAHGQMELFKRKRGTDSFQSYKAGLLWNYFENSYKDNRLAFQINFEKDVIYDLYIKILPEEFYIRNHYSVKILHINELNEIYGRDLLNSKQLYVFSKGVTAILFFFFLVNIGQYFLIRDKSYLYYSFYLICFFLYLEFKFNISLFPNSDILAFYVFSGNWVFSIPQFILFFAYISYAFFVREFLSLTNTKKGIGRYFDIMIKTFLSFVVILSICKLLPNDAYGLSTPIWHGMLVSIMILGTGALYFLFKDKRPLSKFIFQGTLFFSIGVSMGFMVSIGIISISRTDFPLIGIPFFYSALGILTEAIFFSIGLAYRTKSVELEKQLLAKEKEYEIAKTKLYTNITHEFRTPLTIIRGNANLILKNPKIKLEERVKGIRHYSDTLKSLVDDLLDLSKLQSGIGQEKMYKGDIINYLQYTVESFQSLAFSKKISLSFHSEIAELEMDHFRKGLQQIITNLIGNAVKFTPEYGKIKVEIKQRNKNELEIKVNDSGVGIPQDQFEEIFKPFHRVDSDATKESIGTGLGLSIVKQLAENMNGFVEVESTLNKGTSFYVILRLTTNAPPFPLNKTEISKSVISTINHKEEEHPSLGILPKVLIVEDNKDVNQYIRDLLTGSFTVISATNGKIGLEKAIQEQPEIIISDEMMPVMGGFEMIKKLKLEPLTSNIPIIMLTARSSREEELTGLKLQVEAYLTKPLDEEKLMIILENLLEKANTEQTDNLLYWENKPVNTEFMKVSLSILETHHSKGNFKAFDLKYKLQKEGYGAERKVEKAIKEHFATTPAKLILSFRLEKAKALLTNKIAMSIPEIIENVGLECDQSYFTRIYKEKFDITPGDERK